MSDGIERNEERFAGEITVLMLGNRRTGKSSILSSMINSMDNVGLVETNLEFSPDASTRVLMNKKLSQLKLLFSNDAIRNMEKFDTTSGEFGGEKLTTATNEFNTYTFTLRCINERNRRPKRYKVDFVDIPGDWLTDGRNSGKVTELVEKSSVIFITVDSPALFEYRRKETQAGKDVGECHNAVNSPQLITEALRDAYLSLKGANDDKGGKASNKMTPKLVVFVPTKCEKYHYGCNMGDLKAAVKRGYKPLFDFLESAEEFTTAISPILTLGGIVFDSYETVTSKSGIEMVKSMKDAPGIPEHQYYKFKKDGKGQIAGRFEPKYCEQPLYYILAYINAIYEKARKSENSIKAKLKEGGKWTAAGGLFGIPGLTSYFVYKIIKGKLKELFTDENMMKALKNAPAYIETDDPGFGIIYDHLGINELIKEAKEANTVTV